jgi:hypothetical protein
VIVGKELIGIHDAAKIQLIQPSTYANHIIERKVQMNGEECIMDVPVRMMQQYDLHVLLIGSLMLIMMNRSLLGVHVAVLVQLPLLLLWTVRLIRLHQS